MWERLQPRILNLKTDPKFTRQQQIYAQTSPRTNSPQHNLPQLPRTANSLIHTPEAKKLALANPNAAFTTPIPLEL